MLDTRPDEFDHRNLFLHALLGLLSACRRLDEAAKARSDEAADPVPPDDPFLLFVLGMMSFRLRLGEALDAVPPPAEDEVSRPKENGKLDVRGMLR